MEKYTLGKYQIDIPQGFGLPEYQKAHKLYDRFLPILVKYVDADKVIVDVGANIGDTVVALIQNCDNPVVCIEPSDVFFPFLKRNVERLSTREQSRILLYKEFVGTGKLVGSLKHTEGGTASLKMEQELKTPTHVALDVILEDKSNIILLKVDTDGFDFDVIRSSSQILTNSQPVLFWENYISDDFQFEGFSRLYELLEECGYRYVYVFDNFGNLIIEDSGFDALKQINAYVYTMEKNSCTRTFNYTDILATTEKYIDLTRKAVNDFKMNFIYK